MSNAGNISVQILVGSPSFSLGGEFLGPFVALCLIPKVVNIFHPPLFDCLSGVLSKVSPTPPHNLQATRVELSNASPSSVLSGSQKIRSSFRHRNWLLLPPVTPPSSFPVPSSFRPLQGRFLGLDFIPWATQSHPAHHVHLSLTAGTPPPGAPLRVL